MPEQNRVDRFIQAFPKYLLLFTILFLITIYILIWLIDFKQVYVPGLTEWKDQFPAPIFWLQVFREQGIVENLQWLFLAFSTILTVMMAIIENNKRKKYVIGWLTLSFGLFIMFLEDTVNLRHKLNRFLAENLHFGPGSLNEWAGSIYGISVEITVYTLLGLLMLNSFYRLYFSALNIVAKKYMLAGFIFYGIASIASATRNIGDWYIKIGTIFLDYILKSKELTWASDSVLFMRAPLSFYFIDNVIEESFELIGATLLLCMILAQYCTFKNE